MKKFRIFARVRETDADNAYSLDEFEIEVHRVLSRELLMDIEELEVIEVDDGSN